MTTIEHLSGYLPYKLKVKLENFPIGNGIRSLELDCGHDFHFYLANGYVKPLLRPLSDLTDEEWIQVFNAGFNNAQPRLSIPIELTVDQIERHDDLAIEFVKAGTNSGMFYDFKGCTFDCYGVRFNQLAAYNELFKLHADLYYLIDKGLAIDEATLNLQS